MRIQSKVTSPAGSPRVPERGFFTEADIRMIIQGAVQEAVAALMADDEEEETGMDNKQPSAGEKLTLTVQEAADLVWLPRKSTSKTS